MANAGDKGIIKYVETLAIPNLSTGRASFDAGTARHADIGGTGGFASSWIQSMDSGNSPYTRSVSATRGLHIAGSLDATDNDYMELSGDELMFFGQQGFNAVETLVQFDAVANLAFNFGFTDEITCASATLPVELGTATLVASGCTTFLGIVYDVDADNDELHAAWVDDAVVVTEALGNLRMRGLSPAANTWLWLRVEMQDQGSGQPVRATFHAVTNGKHVTKEFTTTVDRDQGLTWFLGVENRGATARGIFVRGMGWEQSIAD